MTTFAIGGQGSGDFRETSARVQLLHVVTRNSQGILTPDAFTQANPPVVTTGSTVSTTLASISKVGVLGGTVCFTRPDYGNGFQGGPLTGTPGSLTVGVLPLGVFINDAIGNAFENTPGVASGRGPYVCGTGSCVALSVYETKVLISNSTLSLTAGTALTFTPGQKVWASMNGLITGNVSDSYEANVTGVGSNPSLAAATVASTLMGIVKVAPDANSSLLVIDLRV